MSQSFPLSSQKRDGDGGSASPPSSNSQHPHGFPLVAQPLPEPYLTGEKDKQIQGVPPPLSVAYTDERMHIHDQGSSVRKPSDRCSSSLQAEDKPRQPALELPRISSEVSWDCPRPVAENQQASEEDRSNSPYLRLSPAPLLESKQNADFSIPLAPTPSLLKSPRSKDSDDATIPLLLKDHDDENQRRIRKQFEHIQEQQMEHSSAQDLEDVVSNTHQMSNSSSFFARKSTVRRQALSKLPIGGSEVLKHKSKEQINFSSAKEPCLASTHWDDLNKRNDNYKEYGVLRNEPSSSSQNSFRLSGSPRRKHSYLQNPDPPMSEMELEEIWQSKMGEPTKNTECQELDSTNQDTHQATPQTSREINLPSRKSCKDGRQSNKSERPLSSQSAPDGVADHLADVDIRQASPTHEERYCLDPDHWKHLDPVLPDGWIIVRHHMGMPVYLHPDSRVATFARPYVLDNESVREHDPPLTAIPCLAWNVKPHKAIIRPDRAYPTLDSSQLMDYCQNRFTIVKEKMAIRYGKWKLLQKKALQEEAPKYTLPMTGRNGALIFVPLKNINGLPGTIPIILNNVMQLTHGPAALRFTYPNDGCLYSLRLPHVCYCSINGQTFGIGFAQTRCAARIEASMLTLKKLDPNFPFHLSDTKFETFREKLESLLKRYRINDKSIIRRLLADPSLTCLRQLPEQVLASLLGVDEQKGIIVEMKTSSSHDGIEVLLDIPQMKKLSVSFFRYKDLPSEKKQRKAMAKNLAIMKFLRKRFPTFRTWWDLAQAWIDSRLQKAEAKFHENTPQLTTGEG